MAKRGAKKPVKKKLTNFQKVMGTVSYLWILFLIPLLFFPKDKFIRFHAKQGLVLFLIELAVAVFTLIPLLGWIFGPMLLLILIVYSIIAIAHAAIGKKWKLPFLANLAERL